MLTQVTENIYNIYVELPGSPLKWLNCYVIKGKEGEKSLLLDTGFNRPECTESLLEGLKMLGIQPENTDVFLTHMHSDHIGNAGTLYDMGCRMFMSTIDYDRSYVASDRLAESFDYCLKQGMPEDVYREVTKHNPAVLFRPKFFDYTPISDGDILNYGGYELECIFTPGHTPGHMCLYERKNKIMFLGDHVLFDITPNICAWPGVEDSLGAYIDSLKRIATYDVEIALPAHRNTGNITMYERIDQLICHHERRINEAESIVHENKDITAYEAAGQMTWKIKARNWDDFPLSQKIFALGECQAHLDYLAGRGRIVQDVRDDGIAFYRNKAN